MRGWDTDQEKSGRKDSWMIRRVIKKRDLTQHGCRGEKQGFVFRGRLQTKAELTTMEFEGR